MGRKPEPALLARDPVQLDERHLDPGMSVDARPAAGSQRGVDVRRHARGDREQPVVTQRAVPGHGCLDQMPEAVQLVAPQQVGVGTAAAEHLDERVQVAVVALRSGDEVDRLVRGAADVVVPGPAELPARRLEPLVDVRVEEGERALEHHPERAVAIGREVGREPEVVQRSGCLELRVSVRDRPRAIDLQPIRPEATGDANVAEAERPERPVRATRWLDRRGDPPGVDRHDQIPPRRW